MPLKRCPKCGEFSHSRKIFCNNESCRYQFIAVKNNKIVPLTEKPQMFPEADVTIQNMLPDGFEFLGAHKLASLKGGSPIETRFYARHKNVNNGEPIVASDLRQLATKCYRVHFRPNKSGTYSI